MHTISQIIAATRGKSFLLSLVLLTAVAPIQARESFLKYLQETAAQGEAESRFILGLAYRDGWDGGIKPGTVAARWCDIAAEMDDHRPELVFGLLQKGGERVLPDAGKAAELLTLAAGQGDNYAQVILGEMLLEGKGVPIDWRSGTEWIRKAAVAGFSPAQFRLGVIYLVGDETTPKNDIEALAWFILAAEGGSDSARALRDERTQSLGHEAAYQAVKRSRNLLVKTSVKTQDGG
jgi:TPR repeat protein